MLMSLFSLIITYNTFTVKIYIIQIESIKHTSGPKQWSVLVSTPRVTNRNLTEIVSSLMIVKSAGSNFSEMKVENSEL